MVHSLTKKIANNATKIVWYSLSLVDGVLHGEEDAVHEDGEHDEVVEELVGGEVDGGAS